MSRRGGMTLIEIVVVSALAVLLASLVLQVLLTTSDHTARSLAQQYVDSESRRLATGIANELRDANNDATDLDPYSPGGVSSLKFRVLTGFDTGAQKAVLDPARSTANHRQISYDSAARTIVYSNGVQTINLAHFLHDGGGVTFTKVGDNKIVIVVTVVALDDEGETVKSSTMLAVQLRNAVASAD